jgi:hypothetical protein
MEFTMSRPMDREIDPRNPLAYAPKWARDASISERTTSRQHNFSEREIGCDEDMPSSHSGEASLTDDESATEWSRVSRPLDPVILPPPPVRSRVRVRFAVASGLTICAAAALIAALFMIEKLPSVAKDDSPEVASFDSRFVVDIPAEPLNETALLREALRGTTVDNVTRTTTEGASPTRPASREALLGEALRLRPADDVTSTATEQAIPPPVKQEVPFFEPLRGTSADEVASTTTERASPTSHAPDLSEVVVLLKRGQELMASGDIAAARVVLLRAAEARDAKAALALAATYDPIMLKRSGVYGVAADISAARDWYEKAKEYGSEEAPRRLEILAGREM